MSLTFNNLQMQNKNSSHHAHLKPLVTLFQRSIHQPQINPITSSFSDKYRYNLLIANLHSLFEIIIKKGSYNAV